MRFDMVVARRIERLCAAGARSRQVHPHNPKVRLQRGQNLMPHGQLRSKPMLKDDNWPIRARNRHGVTKAPVRKPVWGKGYRKHVCVVSLTRR